MNVPPRLSASISILRLIASVASKRSAFAALGSFLSVACLVATASATTFLVEDFEGTNPAFATTNFNPGSAITGSLAKAIDPIFSPSAGDQNYVEVLYPGVFAFSTKSVDLNTVGIQFTVTLASAQLLTLSFDYGVDTTLAGPRGAVVEFLDSTSGLQAGPTLSSTPVGNSTASFSSGPFLMAAGTYNLQFASNTYNSSRGVQLDNILLTGNAATSSVPDSGSTLALGGMASVLFLGCRRRARDVRA